MTPLVQSPPQPPSAIASQVAMLAEYFNAGLEPHVLRIYVDALRDIPAADMRAACKRLVLTATFMPKVAEIRAAVEAHQADARDAAQRQAVNTERRAARAELNVFGRMSKNAVLHHFGGFIADDLCDCLACYDAQVVGPPRFVPDGTSPAHVCERCADTGWLSVPAREGVPESVARCACHDTNPQLLETTRTHTIDMGRWLHGHELREHEQAQEAFNAALRGVIARAKMPKISPKDITE